MYSRGELRAMEKKRAAIAEQLKSAKAAADARELRALKSASVRPRVCSQTMSAYLGYSNDRKNNTSLVPEAPNTSAAPPPIESGHTVKRRTPLATKNKVSLSFTGHVLLSC